MAPKTYTEMAVDRLIGSSNLMHSMWDQNIQDEARWSTIKDATPGYIATINKELKQLISGDKAILKSVLSGPKSDFNDFESTWNGGKGSLRRAKPFLDTYIVSLNGAQPQIRAIIASDRVGHGGGPAGPGPALTPQDVNLCAQIVGDTNILLTAFRSCVATHAAGLANRIQTQTATITPLISQLQHSPAAAGALRTTIALWADYIENYKQGRGINQTTLDILQNFDGAITSVRGAAAGPHH